MFQVNIGWIFWLWWALAFLAFPVGGWLASFAVGAVATPARAITAGAITGAVVGLVQWLILRGPLQLSIGWIPATSIGMALGLGLSIALFGSEMKGDNLLWRAALTGIGVGAAQWMFLRFVFPQSAIWIGAIPLGWVTGWFVTRGAGVNLDPKWSVFGAAGALTFQLLTGLVLYFLTRLS